MNVDDDAQSSPKLFPSDYSEFNAIPFKIPLKQFFLRKIPNIPFKPILLQNISNEPFKPKFKFYFNFGLKPNNYNLFKSLLLGEEYQANPK